eukprot:443473_1
MASKSVMLLALCFLVFAMTVTPVARSARDITDVPIPGNSHHWVNYDTMLKATNADDFKPRFPGNAHTGQLYSKIPRMNLKTNSLSSSCTNHQ